MMCQRPEITSFLIDLRVYLARRFTFSDAKECLLLYEPVLPERSELKIVLEGDLMPLGPSPRFREQVTAF